jgi:hypothetical protein
MTFGMGVFLYLSCIFDGCGALLAGVGWFVADPVAE